MASQKAKRTRMTKKEKSQHTQVTKNAKKDMEDVAKKKQVAKPPPKHSGCPMRNSSTATAPPLEPDEANHPAPAGLEKTIHHRPQTIKNPAHGPTLEPLQISNPWTNRTAAALHPIEEETDVNKDTGMAMLLGDDAYIGSLKPSQDLNNQPEDEFDFQGSSDQEMEEQAMEEGDSELASLFDGTDFVMKAPKAKGLTIIHVNFQVPYKHALKPMLIRSNKKWPEFQLEVAALWNCMSDTVIIGYKPALASDKDSKISNIPTCLVEEVYDWELLWANVHHSVNKQAEKWQKAVVSAKKKGKTLPEPSRVVVIILDEQTEKEVVEMQVSTWYHLEYGIEVFAKLCSS
ncbi:hypothetical protein FRB94_001600 [Tulasnella sp. JGI-2019a]|nr:hypothetical protein FRB93_012802 [Tulasnella sp. JGI-2019a]KAG8987655.1 hypothetical protein FRB94_001600 [Tulasnella sp. JGI-2019a]KAG9021764.1 hypothetical protein FRB95_001499 [Tulasnella sp. JGI-2019a]